VNVLTPEERLRHIDQTVDEVKQSFTEAVESGFVKAVEELAQSEEVGQAFEERLNEVGERLQKLPGQLEPSDFERDQLHELHTTLHETRDLVQELQQGDWRRLDILNDLLIHIEVIRHIIRDALDEHVTGMSTDAGGVVAQLNEWLPRTPQRELARLVGVNRRTLLRWSEQQSRPHRRLQLVAQLVAILRHSWSEEGVIAWFDRANHELGDRKPISLLDDPSRERDLLTAARSTRSQYAT
jgi:uncharacterized protein (DUF2384 family)